jgi:Sec-independent protein translocase protein TatA
MNIFRLLFELFLLYLAYKLIFDFIIPVYKASKKMKGQMHNMQQSMREHQKRQSQQTNTPPPTQNVEKAAEKDYIDFEEVKEK